MNVSSSVSQHHLRLLSASCHETPAAVQPSCLRIVLDLSYFILLDLFLLQGRRHFDASFRKKASYWTPLLSNLLQKRCCAGRERVCPLFTTKALRCFVWRDGFWSFSGVWKSASLDCWSMKRVYGDWMCQQVDLGNTSADTHTQTCGLDTV